MLTVSGMKIMNKMGKCVCMVNYAVKISIFKYNFWVL